MATALILQQLFHLCPRMVGEMSEDERQELRRRFYPAMGRGEEQKALFSEWAARMGSGEEQAIRPFTDLRRPDFHRKHQGANCLDPAVDGRVGIGLDGRRMSVLV